MKKISKIFAVVLCLTLLLALLPAGASAATEQCVEFTVNTLGLKAENYTAGTKTIDGVDLEWIQLGNYKTGGGIQMRDSSKGTSKFWNTSAFPGGITKIELTYSDIQSVTYSNANAVIFNFGNDVKGADCTTKLSTTKGVKTYTITPDADTYTYFYMEHDLKYTFYWKSIKVYYNEAASEPEQPVVTPDYYVAGEPALCGSEWIKDDSDNIMTKGEDGLYTKAYENVAAGTYLFKVTDGTWDNCWGDPNSGDKVGNYILTLDALSNVTIIFDAEAKAVSVKVEPIEVLSVGPIADALAGEDGKEFMVKGVVTAIEGGRNIYIQDSTGGICVRAGANVEDLKVGDTIIGTGTKSVYNGLTQLNGSYEKSEGMTLSAKETTIGELTNADICTYIKLSGVTVTEVNDNNGEYATPNIKVSDGTNEIQIYKAVVDKNEDGTWAVKVGDKLDVYAAVGFFNKLQLRNTTADEITVIVDEPENPGQDPENPGQDPENPGQDPENPGQDPENPGQDPENPGQDPENPGQNPENPGQDPENPGQDPENPDEGDDGEEIPVTGDMSVAALVVAMMAATAGAVVIGKKKF